jgi:hypothetical protein
MKERSFCEINREDWSTWQNRRRCSVDLFLQLPYWRRVWIVPEVCLAKDLFIVCPGRWLTKDALKGLHELTTSLRDHLVASVGGIRPDGLSIIAWPALYESSFNR